MVPAFSAPPFHDDQVCTLKHFKMLHHCAAVQIWEMVAQSSGGERLIAQVIQDLAANRRGQSLENLIMLIPN